MERRASRVSGCGGSPLVRKLPLRDHKGHLHRAPRHLGMQAFDHAAFDLNDTLALALQQIEAAMIFRPASTSSAPGRRGAHAVLYG